MSYVSREQIVEARRADLYGFLVSHHPSSVKKEGRYLRLREHDSLVVRSGIPGYVRFSDPDDTGNPIDFLMRYMGYSFTAAVTALTVPCSDSRPDGTSAAAVREQAGPAAFPVQAAQPYSRVYSYLTQTRSVDPRIVNALIRRGLLYQDSPYGNAVFINHERTYCEVRGTLSNVRYHRSIRSLKSSMWWFMAGCGDPCAAYICEGAIDAISLYELMAARREELPGPSIFCSIGGVGNQETIETIERNGICRVILAVDNDNAGGRCRQKNAHLESLIPEGKDWNDDLRRQKARRKFKE